MPAENDTIQVEKRNRLDTLKEEYKLASGQLRRELDDVNRARIARRLENLESEIHALEKEIKETNSGTDSPCELNLDNITATRIQQNHSISESFPFTNRNDELENFKSSFCPPYILLDAPAGFGKTQLLIELGKHFAERNWVVVYALVRSVFSPRDLARNISEALYAHAYYNSALSNGYSAGEAFGAALHNFWREVSQEDQPYEGFILLLDSAENETESLFLELYSNFIPSTETVLRTLKFFSDGRRFRVILGGRHLARPLSLAPLIGEVRHLSPFTFKAVHDGLLKYLSDHNWEENKQLAAHLFYLTGGHPGCYASCVKDFVNTPQEPDRYFERSVSRLWRNLVKPYTDWAIASLGDHASIMEQLSLFRLCNSLVLKHVKDRLQIEQDPHDLADNLTGEFLLHREGRFLKDNIIRRLIVIKMRHEEPERFINLCRTAQQVCFDQISHPKVQSPEQWVIEYLFLKVQEIAHLRNTQTELDENARSFFEEEVPYILKGFLSDRKIPKTQWREERDTLVDFIKKDWEFQFMLNYAFRKPKFNEEPYQILLQDIYSFFEG